MSNRGGECHQSTFYACMEIAQWKPFVQYNKKWEKNKSYFKTYFIVSNKTLETCTIILHARAIQSTVLSLPARWICANYFNTLNPNVLLWKVELKMQSSGYVQITNDKMNRNTINVKSPFNCLMVFLLLHVIPRLY
jgi:hypothetical protein